MIITIRHYEPRPYFDSMGYKIIKLAEIDIETKFIESVKLQTFDIHKRKSITINSKFLGIFNTTKTFDKYVKDEDVKLYKTVMSSGSIYYFKENPFDYKGDV